MSVKLKLQPFSSTVDQTKSISFVLSGLDASKKYRISFENATLNKPSKVISCDNGIAANDKIIVSNAKESYGKIDLCVNDSDSVSVVSVYANIEEYIQLEEWKLSDIAAFSFQIENPSKKTTGDKVSVYPPFVGLQQKATIKIKTEPNSNMHVIVNNKRFVVRSNFSGEGSFSFRAIDVLGGSVSSSNTLQKFPVTYSKFNDGYTETYDSGSFIHFVPEEMKALQSLSSDAPECAILDPEPGEGLTLEKLDEYCIDGAVVGSMSIFDKETSDFYNSKVGFCTEPKVIYPLSSDESVCRIFNSTSCSSLSNGSGLVAFSSQETFQNDTSSPILSSRIFIANIPGSLKYKGNPVRNGSIIKPPSFYHTVTPSDVKSGDVLSITFRSDDSTFFEIQYTSLQGSVSEVVSGFVELINNDLTARSFDILAVDHSSFIELRSDNRFSIKANTISGDTLLSVSLKSNKTLDLITDQKAINDLGDTVVFLFPKVGYQSHLISSRDTVNNIIRISVPSGFNNGIGPDISESIYCQQFVIVDSVTESSSIDLVDVNPLPYIYDIFGKEVSSVYPYIEIKKSQSGEDDIAYVVCQAPVNGIYQLFFFSFRVGSPIENTKWKQLTSVGENKNAKIKCDNMGNLHFVWESDRMGPTQVYYSVLGPSSRGISNSVAMSIINKNITQNNEVNLISVSDPKSAIQDDWTRIISNNGKVSVYDSGYIAIEGSPSEDSAMAFYSLSTDEFGNDIPWSFGQLSYQLSFDFLMPLLSTGILQESDIEAEFLSWKNSFVPVGDYRYKKDDNIYTIDSYSNFYEGVIPICGSYKLDSLNLTVASGGATVDGVSHNSSLTYAIFEQEATLSEPSNINHFMLAMMPEKIRFKAKNTESYSQYCERLGQSSGDCSGFNNEIIYEIGTGKYKLALLVSTSENETTGSESKKNYKISRFLSGYIDFETKKNIKIAVHYSKSTSDYIEGVSIRENNTVSNEYRYSGDIIIIVEDSPVFATSFLADFSDQYRKFDIALGFPPGQGFVISESIPYKGNMYEKGSFSQTFNDVHITPHSVSFNQDYVNISKFDRNTSQMVLLEKINNIISNGSFDDTVLPFKEEYSLLDGYQGVTGWTSVNDIIYRRLVSESSDDISGWIELTGSSISSKGGIYKSFTTEIGKEYVVSFDLSNSVDSYLQGPSITKKVRVSAASSSSIFSTTISSTSLSSLDWSTRRFSFIATSSQTTITFTNASDQFGDIRDIEYGPQIDNVVVVLETELNDELSSFSTAETLMIDQSEFDLNYSLNATDSFLQLPATVSLQFQNKNPDIFIDNIDKLHLTWQSNRDDFWNIYYSGFRFRGEPFRFDTRISSSESSSVNPSIAVDGKGRRFITWQDNRSGDYQIYAAISKSIDDQIVDNCKLDESKEHVYLWNSSIDPYFDPYVLPISQMNCAIEFQFSPSDSGLYHFNLSFYEDKEKTIPYRFINSKSSISGWKYDSKQLSYSGLSAISGESYTISYIPSYEDDLSGRVLYVFVEFEVNASPVDYDNSINTVMLKAYSGLNLNISRKEDNSCSSMFEFEGLSVVDIPPQTIDSVNVGSFSGLSFESPLVELPGASVGDKVKSVLLHFDPVGVSGDISSVIKFTSPISAIYLSNSGLISSKEFFGYPGVKYSESSGIEMESLDTVYISSDRKSITVSSKNSQSIDEIRVILSDSSSVIGNDEFAYYCPSTQSSRCDIKCEFSNNNAESKFVHFRVSFYVDVEKTDLVMSSFTKTDTLNWVSGSDSFPTEGLQVDSNQSINAVYSPEITPFELYESQTRDSFSSSIIRQPLICGSSYHVVIESYIDGTFYTESESSFICPCHKVDSDSWNKETDSISWICSGQGFDDFRLSITDNQCLFPKINVTSFDLFYITWQDFRYSRIKGNQSIISPDCFMGMYNSDTDEFICSGQGSYDRRLTNFSSSDLILYDYSVFVDPFQNINIATHDGSKIYSQSCSLGCELSEISKKVSVPCMFTDETDSSLFVIGGSPDRTVDQYQKIRISEKYVAYSTYVDLQKPVPVVNDCFLEFDIIGVPGTYAYRLRNDNDQDWSEWLPIGPDLPVQSQTDTSNTQQERDFFKAYFTQRDTFVAPWVISSGNGTKRVCCEILTFFGKTETFCVDFVAIYNDLEYTVDLFFDEEFKQPVPKFKNYMVVSESKTKTIIDESNLTSIKEDIESVSVIYAKVEFKDKNKINLIEKIQSISRFNYLDSITMSVYQQGLNDQMSIPLVKIKEGIYSGSFSVDKDDGVVNVDGLAIIVIDVPGQCKSFTFEDLSRRAEKLESNKTLDQDISIFNDFTVFRDKYEADDLKGSFANPNYYKTKKFGISSIQKPWLE